MSDIQHVESVYTNKRDELTHRIEGVEAAIQAAMRNDDDQEWLEYLYQRRDALKGQLAQEVPQ